MNNNQVRGQQWRKLIGEYFAPRYGGEKENWSKANTKVMKYIIDYLDEIQLTNSHLSFKEFHSLENKIWVEKMFEYVGLPCPKEEEYDKIVHGSHAWIIPQVQSSYEGISDVIRDLSKTYVLHTASNESSTTLDLYVTDLMKSSVDYYKKILAFSKISAEKAIVVDDNPTILRYAESVGLTVVQSCQDGQKPEYDNYFIKATELRQILINL